MPKPIQIATALSRVNGEQIGQEVLYVLLDDGTIWARNVLTSQEFNNPPMFGFRPIVGPWSAK